MKAAVVWGSKHSLLAAISCKVVTPESAPARRHHTVQLRLETLELLMCNWKPRHTNAPKTNHVLTMHAVLRFKHLEVLNCKCTDYYWEVAELHVQHIWLRPLPTCFKISIAFVSLENDETESSWSCVIFSRQEAWKVKTCTRTNKTEAPEYTREVS